MSKRKLGFLAAAAMVVGGAVAGNLAIGSAGADGGGTTLSGYEETPANVTTGTGTFRLSIDDASQTITWGLRWSGLAGGSASVAHIHVGQKGVAGGVSAFFCGGSTKPACPAGTSGAIQGTIVPSDVIGPTGQGVAAGEWSKLVQAIRAGNTYANIHNAMWPGGEIRGQVTIGP